MPYTAAPDLIDLHTLRAERLEHDDPPRDLLARHVLAITALFAGAVDLQEQAVADAVPDGPAGPGYLTLEQHVRDLADAAESTTLYLTGRRNGDVLYEVLGEEYLLDDYLRIVSAEQHDAFGDDVTESERDAHLEHLSAIARRAQAGADASAARALEDARVCWCGSDYGTHRRRSYGYSSAAPSYMSPWGEKRCRSFHDIDSVPCAHVPQSVLPAAVTSWAKRNAIVIDDEQHRHVMGLLGELRSGGKGRTLPLGEALPALFTAVGSSTT